MMVFAETRAIGCGFVSVYMVPDHSWRIVWERHEGDGPLLVYLHGLGCAGSRDWHPVAVSPALAGRASLWVDLLGFGQSDHPHDFGYDLAEQAELLATLLAAPGVVPAAEPFVLVGHSMGGTLAILLAERLLALGRTPAAVLVAEPVLRPADAGMSAIAASKSESRFTAAWSRWVEFFPSAHYRENMRLAAPVGFHRSAVSLVHHGATMLERFVRLPLLKGYVLGAKSNAATHETARLVAAAGIPVAHVNGSGHGFSEDDPSGFAAAIADLLAPRHVGRGYGVNPKAGGYPGQR